MLNVKYECREMTSVLKTLFFQKNKYKDMTDLTTKEYFFGKISRPRAEEILLESGGEDGRFLVRESISSPMNFSMAVCFNRRPYHYQFQLHSDGTVKVSRGASFINVDKMISHYSNKSSGLITRLIHPCQRDVFGGAQVWPSISQSKALLYMTEAGKEKSSKFEDVIGRIYRFQSWFKGGMTREESKKYLLKRRNGDFIIREKRDGTLALSLVYEMKDYHYVIEIKSCPKTGSNSYKINPGPEFDNIMELITYYHNGGLACPLRIKYEESKASIPWLKYNPAYKVRENNETIVTHANVNKDSKSLESLNNLCYSSANFICNDRKFGDCESISSYPDPRNRNIMADEAFKDHAILEFPKSQDFSELKVTKCFFQHPDRFGKCDQKISKNSEISNFGHFISNSSDTNSSIRSSQLTFEPKNKLILKERSSSLSPNVNKKTFIKSKEKATEIMKKMKHQNTLASDQKGIQRYPSATADIKVHSQARESSLMPPRPHIPSNEEKFHLQMPLSKVKQISKPISYELEEDFVAMVKKGAFHVGKKVPSVCRTLSNATVKSDKVNHLTFPENLPHVSEKQLLFSTTIGRGHFGIVHEATLNGSFKVAVKTSTPGPHKILSESELIKEAYLMSFMEHDNIIKLIGICRATENLMLVLELAHLGNLKNFLGRNRDTPERQIILALKQICDGMSYLETMQIVHRDLAARNVLLFQDWVAKISDFGLSRSMNSKSYYEFTGDRELPLKWYPPEVFNDSKFSHKSDVWSFGVTIWESMSCGVDPYSGLKSSEYIDFINSGHRLKKPNKCSERLYEVMHKCWQTSEKNRPTFEELKRYLKTPYITIVEP